MGRYLLSNGGFLYPMIQLIHDKIAQLGLNSHLAFPLAYAALVLGILFVAVVADWVTKRLILRAIGKIIRRTRSRWDNIAFKKGIFSRLSHLTPAVIFYLSAPLLVMEDMSWTQSFAAFVQRVAQIYFVVILALVADATLNTIQRVYRDFEVAKNKPIRSYVQVAKIFLFFVFAVLVLSIILDRSPWAFLTGLGAMAAVIMLIFKDSILGFVASVQISAYDTIHIGDWIEMPKFGADGDVVELSLNTIKVQNWDKTIVSIPTSAVLTDSIKNWRGMSESGGRRIKRHINIDMNTIQFCNEEMLDRFSKIKYIAEYIQKKTEEIQSHNQGIPVDRAFLINGRHLTNFGTFRAYVESYLHHHEQIHDDMTFLVRHLQPTAEGIPIEIYVFTKDTRWPVYEGIQADIFDHILAVVPLFDLRVFQDTSGQNYKIDIVSMPGVAKGN